MHDSIERRQRHAHVGGMRGDAGGRCAKDRVIAIKAVDGVAARAGRALVATRGVVIKIGAAGALQDVAADGGHVADLPARAREDCPRQQREALAHRAICGERGVLHRRPDQHAAVVPRLDRSRKAGHVDQRLRSLDRLAHQVDEVGAATEILCVRPRAGEADRVVGCRRAREYWNGVMPAPSRKLRRSPRQCRYTRRSGTNCRSSARAARHARERSFQPSGQR